MSMSFAISSPLDRLLSTQSGSTSHAARSVTAVTPEPHASSIDTAGSQTPAHSLGAMLGRLGVERSEGAASSDPASLSLKPNLDALNRVLNHYAAQSAAVDSIISLVRS